MNPRKINLMTTYPSNLNMDEITKQKVLKYLEEIQIECLKHRFGDTYESDFFKLQEQKLNSFEIDEPFLSHPTNTQEEQDFLSLKIEEQKTLLTQTKFENVTTFTILQTLFEDIEKTAKRIGLETKTRPTIGTALSKEYNAFAEKVPETNEHIIVFEGEIFTLCNMLAKLIALCLPDFKIVDNHVSFNLSIDRIENHIKTNKLLQERFADLVYNIIFLGQPNKTQQYYIPEIFLKLNYELLSSIELFIVGHEYGHIYYEHLNDGNIVKHPRRDKIRYSERIRPNWIMEYEADTIGLILLLNTINKDSLYPFCLLGPELFFTFLDIEERAINLYKKGIEKRSFGSNSHPPNVERRKRIREQIEIALPKQFLESYKDLSGFLENAIECLWSNYKENIANQPI